VAGDIEPLAEEEVAGNGACPGIVAGGLGSEELLVEEGMMAVQILGSDAYEEQGQWWSMVDRTTTESGQSRATWSQGRKQNTRSPL
jgi:hypothetical protein